MRKPLLFILALLASVSIQTASAQQFVASAKNGATTAQTKYLKEVLGDMQSRYQTAFVYKTNLVETATVSSSFEMTGKNLEKDLRNALAGNNLAYQKAGQNLFVITAKETQTAVADDVTGRVKDSKTGEALPGVSILIKGTTRGTTSDANGNYKIAVGENATLVYSFVGYVSKDVAVGGRTAIDVALESSSSTLGEVQVVGSRSTVIRSQTETLAPVDVITSKELAATGQTDPTQMLHFVAPSFNSSRQTIADGTDHIDPATLRGLGPDQVLLLVNGKRRHNQSLININGTVGRGSVGTDLNAIPAAAIERLEVLRDGASSQYGSDAIAGVINVVMKNSVGTSATAHYGAYSTEYEPTFNQTAKRSMTDGQTLQFSVYHGMKVGKGKLSLAVEYRDRKSSNRSGDFTGTVFNSNKTLDDPLVAAAGFDRTFNLQVGNSSSQNVLGYLNFTHPVGKNSEFYLNAGFASRQGVGKGFYRYPKQNTQVIAELYPNGFLPEIHSTLGDYSAMAGVKGTFGSGWKYDISNVFGTNNFRFDVKNSNNASQFALKAQAPKEFYAGTLSFGQNTTNLDISKALTVAGLKSLNFAAGAEVRIDMFNIKDGEEASWKNYDLTAKPLRVGGSQVFPGYQPSNVISQSRTVMGAYVDVESDITDKFLVSVAARVENYSDFGANVAGKLAARYKLADAFSVRASVSNGFRAPSIHQRYFSNTSTQFVVNAATGQTVPNNVGIFRNNDPIATALGIPTLTSEKSTNLSVGVTSRIADAINITVDAYQIDINNRIVLTGNMARTNPLINTLLNGAGVQADVTQVAFFTNAINTRTKGLDIVIAASPKIGKGVLDLTGAINFNKTEIMGATKTTDKLPSDQFGKTFFSRLEESRIVVGQPRDKFAFSAAYRVGGFNASLRGTRFGEVSVWDATNVALDEVFSPRTLIDASVGYRVKAVTLTLGANNLTDVYPDKIKNAGNSSDGRFVYSRNVTQFGFGGRYLYGALRIDL